MSNVKFYGRGNSDRFNESELHSWEKFDADANQFNQPDADKFKLIYTLCGIGIALSILFPEIRSGFRLEFFWEDSYFEFWDFLLFLVPVFFGIGVVIIAHKVSPRIRCRIFFIFFTAIAVFGVGVSLISISFFQLSRYAFQSIFTILLIIAPITSYSFVVLQKKFTKSAFRAIALFSSIVILFALFVPIFDDVSLALELYDDPNDIHWFFLVPLYCLSVILTFLAPFSKSPKKLAIVNTYLLRFCIFYIPVGIIFSEHSLSWRDFSEIIKAFFAVFGVYFLICYSIIEYYTVRLTVKILPFAQPVKADSSDFVPTVFDKIDDAEPENSEPYKLPNQ